MVLNYVKVFYMHRSFAKRIAASSLKYARHIILKKKTSLFFWNKSLEMHHFILNRVLTSHYDFQTYHNTGKTLSSSAKRDLMWVYFWQGYTLGSQYHFAPIIYSCTISCFALFLAPVGTLSACSHRAAATYQFGSTFHLCGWYLSPMRRGVAAVSLSTCWAIVLPGDSMSALFPTHHTIIIQYVVCNTFPLGKRMGA